MLCIVGSWSADLQYSPGAACDEWLTFLDTGVGFLEIINWGHCSVEKFTWRPTAQGILEVETEWAIYNDGHDNFEKENDFIFGSKSIEFKVEVGQSPVYGASDFLIFTNFSINYQSRFGKVSNGRSILERLKEFGSEGF